MSEKRTNERQNITFNHVVDGIFNDTLETRPEMIGVEQAGLSELVIIRNSLVRAELRRPTLDGANSELWEAPWDASLKMRMRIDLSSANGNKFSFSDLTGNSYLLDEVELAVLADGSTRPFFQNQPDHMVGEPLAEKYLIDLFGSEHFEHEPVQPAQ